MSLLVSSIFVPATKTFLPLLPVHISTGERANCTEILEENTARNWNDRLPCIYQKKNNFFFLNFEVTFACKAQKSSIYRILDWYGFRSNSLTSFSYYFHPKRYDKLLTYSQKKNTHKNGIWQTDHILYGIKELPSRNRNICSLQYEVYAVLLAHIEYFHDFNFVCARKSTRLRHLSQARRQKLEK